MKSPLLAALLVACGTPTHEVASHYVKSQLISAAQGGSIAVTESDDPLLAGTSIVIPAGALSADTTITIAEGASPVAPAGTQAAGPVATFGPDGTKFQKPVTITIPYELPGGAAAVELEVAAVESSGAETTLTQTQLTLNTTASTVAFSANGFTSYGGFVPPPTDGGMPCKLSSDCPPGQACNGGVCVPAGTGCGGGTYPDGGAWSGTDCPSNSCADLQTDSANCGACGNVCPSGACVSGVCATGSGCFCGSNAPTCCQGTNCVDLQTDSSNCGACGTICPSGEQCLSGGCANPGGWGCTLPDGGSCGTSDGGQAACVTACGIGCTPRGVNCFSDGNDYCSSCVAACYGATQVACTSCPSGMILCGGVCVFDQTDSSNCGACGNVCPSGQSCVSGRCA